MSNVLFSAQYASLKVCLTLTYIANKRPKYNLAPMWPPLATRRQLPVRVASRRYQAIRFFQLSSLNKASSRAHTPAGGHVP